jgi:hypothetical protein
MASGTLIGIPWWGPMAGESVVVILSFRHRRGCQGPALFGQWTAAMGAVAALAVGGANRRPLLIEPAAFFGLVVKLGLEGLDGPRRTGMVIALCGVFRHDVSFPAHGLLAVHRESALRSCGMWT